MCGIFVHKWEKMAGGETDLHNVELRKNLKLHGITEFHDVLTAKERRCDEFRLSLIIKFVLHTNRCDLTQSSVSFYKNHYFRLDGCC